MRNATASVFLLLSIPGAVGNTWNIGYGLGADNAVAGFNVEHRMRSAILNFGFTPYPMASAGLGWVFSEKEKTYWEAKSGYIRSTDFHGGYLGLKWTQDFGAPKGFAWQAGVDFNYWRFFEPDENRGHTWLAFPYPALTLNYLW
ncbi:MAG TPA: hypothetical protein VHO02_06660 [Fibrobacteria bacterium]|nr:hypothetical protein [Fibrobacteria bacterium]